MSKVTILIYVCVAIISVYIGCHHFLSVDLTSIKSNSPDVEYTIRVNTFRRNDLLEKFLDHYQYCDEAKEIQVVWSDQSADPPFKWLKRYPAGKVHFEVHAKNSLNNRFMPQRELLTDAVLSIDDDLIVDCGTLRFAAGVWQANPWALVGFSPRIATIDHETGITEYKRWQHTWWNGFYSIVLTKISFLHKAYLKRYTAIVPNEVLTYVDEHRNCEDLTMAYIIASDEHNARPVWVSGQVWEEAASGISSGASHFEERGKCLAVLDKYMPTPEHWPWLLSNQKAKTLSISDIYRLVGWGSFR